MKSKEGLFFVLRHFANKSARLCYILGQKNAFSMFLLLKKDLPFSKCLSEFALTIIYFNNFPIYYMNSGENILFLFFLRFVHGKNVSKRLCDRVKIAFIA